MKVVLDGEESELATGSTVVEVLEKLALSQDGRGIAVAVNATVVPRGHWTEHVLNDGDRIEIVRAIQGG